METNFGGFGHKDSETKNGTPTIITSETEAYSILKRLEEGENINLSDYALKIKDEREAQNLRRLGFNNIEFF